MNPRILEATAIEGHKLKLIFDNGEQGSTTVLDYWILVCFRNCRIKITSRRQKPWMEPLFGLMDKIYVLIHYIWILQKILMWRDPIVEEVQRIREEYAARYNYDIKAICRAAREQQKTSGHKIVSLSPRAAIASQKTDAP